MRYCKDCRYFRYHSHLPDECHHPKNLVLTEDELNGIGSYYNLNARQMRQHVPSCGPAATLFRPSLWYTIRSTILELLGLD